MLSAFKDVTAMIYDTEVCLLFKNINVIGSFDKMTLIDFQMYQQLIINKKEELDRENPENSS